MSLIALTIVALLAGQSFAFPFGGFSGYGFDDFGGLGGYGFDGGFGGYDIGGYGFGGGFDGGFGGGYGGGFGGDFGGNGVGDFGEYGGIRYPGAAGYAREDFVRGSPYGGTEYGTRRESAYRPPYSRFYSTYYPYRVNGGGFGGGFGGFGSGFGGLGGFGGL